MAGRSANRTGRTAPRSFASPRGRRFTLRKLPDQRGRWGLEQTWIVYYAGKPAGKLYADSMYGEGLPWHATTRQLYWTYASDAPTGVGFDVSAFKTAGETLRVLGNRFDEILDWHQGREVHTMYGTSSRGVRSRRDRARGTRRRVRRARSQR